MVKNRMYFGSLLAGVDHLPHTLDLEKNRFSRGQPNHGAELADALEQLVALHDASTIAAVIVEPVAGSIGVYPPPVGYLQRLRAITERHGILLIFDEVITAYGRLGTGSAAEYFGVQPDLVTTAKGLTSGTVPMGAVMARKHVHDAIVHGPGAGPEKAVELFHGYTYSAHPLACAAALATLETYREESLFERAKELAPLLGGAAAFAARPPQRDRHPQYRPDGRGRGEHRARASPASAPTTPCCWAARRA